MTKLFFFVALFAAALSQTCTDLIMNGDETGVDIGGSCPPPPPWWPHWGDYLAVELYIAISLVAVAIVFETIHESAEWGIATRLGENGLAMRVWNRMNAEFMVLGFLAFTVWVVDRSKGFETAAVNNKNGIGPTLGLELLIVVEDTHMRLFMAMCLYFICCIFIIVIGDRKVRGWAWEYEQRMLLNEGHAFEQRKNPYLYDSDVTAYNNMREKFIAYLSSEEVSAEIRAHVSIKGKALSEDTYNDLVENFNFAAYLIKSFENLMTTLVHVSKVTWFGVFLLFLIIGLVVDLSLNTSTEVLWLISSIEVAVFIYVLAIVIMAMVEYRTTTSPSGWGQGCFGLATHCGGFERGLFKALACGLFYLCYMQMWFITSDPALVDWASNGNPERMTGHFLIGFLVPFLVILLGVAPHFVWKFAVVTCLPPYVDHSELGQVVLILLGEFDKEEHYPRLYAKQRSLSQELEEHGFKRLHYNLTDTSRLPIKGKNAGDSEEAEEEEYEEEASSEEEES